MSTATLTRSGLTEAMRLLQAARDRQLVAVTDVVDRAHLVWASLESEATAAETQMVKDMLAAGWAQLGDYDQTVPWYGGTQAHGRRVLPTERGLSALDRWNLCDTVSGGWAGVS
jgi:hypothetical protein